MGRKMAGMARDYCGVRARRWAGLVDGTIEATQAKYGYAQLRRAVVTTGGHAPSTTRSFWPRPEREVTMEDKEVIRSLVAEVLDGTELSLQLDGYRLQEDLETREAKIECRVHDARTGEKLVIEGHGVGMIDAWFNGIVARFAEQYPSLKTIRFADLSVRADMESGRKQKTDSNAEVTLTVANTEGREFSFGSASPSVSRSSLDVVLQAAEFFINTERAYIQVYRALQHARSQNRPDSLVRYTKQLTTLVEATSYSETIEKIRKEDLSR
jgi:hypothetical protein